ncbi:MAG: DUF4185 domain-containing protein, partial [Candidatus Sumerlaeota bacterium]|nr:DUF4185 domain-containing protein [Candidatus Sumerlaeota bacterium]
MRIRRGGTIVALLAIAAAGGGRPAPASTPALEYHPGTTRKIIQLIGDTDWPLRHATITQTYSKAHLYGTDLGEPFEHQGKLYLTFGDSDGGNGGDCLGFTSATKPSELTDLDLVKDASNVYIPIKIGSYATGSYDTPSGGISLNGAIYIAYATESDSYPSKENNRRGILGKSTDGGKTWTYLYDTDYAPGSPPDFTYHHFIRLHMEKVAAADYPGLPWTSGDVVLIYGMSHDGNVDPNPDDIYLACVPLDSFESGKSAWMYFTGLNMGAPTWSPNEPDAVPLLDDGGHDSIDIF